uniref:Ulp1 protease family, C-terminal catalytic domain containing protein n=1 Tax=Solanum tuberosum TaxID=4113 RepID=M1DWS3_SOLTU
MEDDLNLFKSYPWGKQSFDLTLTYLKNRINLRKQRGMHNEKKNACYALYGFSWDFLVWIYEAFTYLGKYAGKSLDTPLPVPRLLGWYTSKSDDIVEGDPFKSKGRSTKIVHPYFIPTVREMGQNYMKIFKPYTDEVKDAVIDVLKAQLKGVTILTAVAVNIVDEVAGDAINEVAKEKEEEKTKEKSVDDEEEKKEDECFENSVDVIKTKEKSVDDEEEKKRR